MSMNSPKTAKGRVPGKGYKLALAVMMMLAAQANGLTPMFGKKSGVGGFISQAITWYSDEDCTSTAGVITPWQVNSNTCHYAILEASKFDKTSSFPDVPVYFGTDGVTIGSRISNSTFYNLNGGATLTFPQATIFSGEFGANGDNPDGTILRGNYTLVKTGTQPIIFNAINTTTTRGFDFQGRFVSDSDVTAEIRFGNYQLGVRTNPIGLFKFNGDFSSFKGSFAMLTDVENRGANLAYMDIKLLSASALGDTSYPRHDALVLRHRAHLSIADAVVQDGTRGITLELSTGKFVCLNAAANSKWTLRAPLYGANGTLMKVGAGTVTLAGPMEIKDIVVTNGTLVVASTATFPQDAHITVKSGCTLISRVGPTLPVAYTLEEGARFSFLDVIPYENGQTTALDYTDLTAQQYQTLTRPIFVELSQPIPLPVNTTQELACVRFPAGMAQAADFSNITARVNYDLPNSWFKVVNDAETGDDVLTLVVKPAIVRTGGDVYRPLSAQYTFSRTINGYTTTPVWSDGLAAHPGADYIHANNKELGSWDGYDNNTRTFAGDSLYLTSYVNMKSARLVIYNLTLDGGGFTDVPGAPTVQHFDGGPFFLKSGTSLSGREERGTVYSYSLDAELLGSGALTLSASSNNNVMAYVTATNSLYTGKVTISNLKTVDSPSKGTIVQITDPHSLGGPLPSFTWDALVLDKFSLVRPKTTMTMDTTNRGIAINQPGGGFFVPDGVSLTVSQTIRFNNAGSVKLCKEGAGTLALAGTVQHGTTGANLVDGVNNLLQVDAGFLRSVGTNGYSTLNISFASGAGVEVDPAATGDEKEYGIYRPLGFAPMEAGGKILVKPAASFAINDAPLFTAAVCTVPAAMPDLTGSLQPAAIKGYTGSVTRDADTHSSKGLVVYTVKWGKTGFSVIIR